MVMTGVSAYVSTFQRTRWYSCSLNSCTRCRTRITGLLLVTGRSLPSNRQLSRTCAKISLYSKKCFRQQGPMAKKLRAARSLFAGGGGVPFCPIFSMLWIFLWPETDISATVQPMIVKFCMMIRFFSPFWGRYPQGLPIIKTSGL